MDGRLHQSDKRDSRALFSLALILLLFYLISETRAERSDDAPCVDKMNGVLFLSLFLSSFLDVPLHEVHAKKYSLTLADDQFETRRPDLFVKRTGPWGPSSTAGHRIGISPRF